MRIKFFIIQLVAFLLLTQLHQTESFAILATLLSAVKFSGNWCLTAFTGFLGFHGSEMLFSLMRGDRDKFADLQKDMREGFEKINNEIATSSEVIVNRLTTQIYANGEFNRIFQRIEDYLLLITTQFKNLQKLLDRKDDFQNDTLYKSVDYLTSGHEGTVQSAMYKLDSIINERSISSQLSKGAIMAIINYLNAQHEVKHCDFITAPSEVLYVFLHYLTMIHLKGMVTIQEAYNLLAHISKKEVHHYSAEYQRVERDTIDHINNLMSHMDKLGDLSPYSYACMPKSYVENKHYVKFEKFLPLYIAFEYGMEHFYKTRTLQATSWCSETCDFYDMGYFAPNPKQKLRINTVNTCWGMIRNCKISGLTDPVCMQPSNSTVLYRKDHSKCTLKAETRSSLYNFYKCDSCQCSCDSHIGENYIYKKPMMAKDNKVVTGVRFEKKNNAIFVNIETSSVLPFAFGNNNDAEWESGPNLDENISSNRDIYFKMHHWCRHIALSDVRVARDEVVVGVQLAPVPGKRCVLALRVFGRQINMLSGKFTSDGIHIYEPKIDKSPEIIDMENLIGGVDAKAQQVTTSQNGSTLIKISHSAIGDHLGQNTLPYFDSQPVLSSPRMMQAGVGLFYRTTEKYGGYLAPRMMAFNTWDYLKDIEKKPEIVRNQLENDAKDVQKLAQKSLLDYKN
ncbi:uncharacterized protein LOC134828859 [Culicoides brevitarsis]|uniref:uncharacterized protein LOC134828859 n=1 Tax=Culicoides brevitarsis TaxID=469753 RepID=UPI00307C5E71